MVVVGGGMLSTTLSDYSLLIDNSLLEVVYSSILNLLPGLVVFGGAVSDHMLLQCGFSGTCFAAVPTGQLGQDSWLVLLRLLLLPRVLLLGPASEVVQHVVAEQGGVQVRVERDKPTLLLWNLSPAHLTGKIIFSLCLQKRN